MIGAGQVRPDGSCWERASRIGVWNTGMGDYKDLARHRARFAASFDERDAHRNLRSLPPALEGRRHPSGQDPRPPLRAETRYAASFEVTARRDAMSGWIRCPNLSIPARKSSKVSMTPFTPSIASNSSSMRATVA